MKPKILTNPPIKEVIFDIRVEHTAPLSEAEIDKKYSSIKIDYPEKKPIYRLEGNFKIGTTEVTSTQLFLGLQCFSEDKGKIVQLQKDGFAYNQIYSYSGWENFILEARRLWAIYNNEISGEVRRLAIRTINEFEIPTSLDNIGDYLNLKLNFENSLGFSQNELYIRSVLQLNAFRAIIALSTPKPLHPTKTKVILDIDLFCEKLILSPNDSEIEDIIEKMHTIKNNLFFDCFSEQAEEIIK